MSPEPQPPEGFVAHDRTSPFLDLIGPLWSRRGEAGLELAMGIGQRHLNQRGFAHGGVLAALADVALGYAASESARPPVRLITASLTIDYVGPVRAGQVVIATVDVQRVGRRVAFANCYLHSGDERIARASAVFSAFPP